FGRKRSGITARRSDNGHATDEVSHERRQPVVLAVQPVVLHCHILTLDVAGFVEAFAERSGLAHGGLGRPAVDEAHDRHRWLLGACRERPYHRRAAEQGYERAAPHSITSSAMASSGCGTSRPSALAVLRLIANSNLVGCSTGSSTAWRPAGSGARTRRRA